MKDPFTGKPLTPSEEALLRRALRLWGLFALGALVAGWLALWIVSLTQPVIVPRIVGLSDKEAQRLLKSKSLKMTVEGRQTDEHLGPDSVVTQKPIANSYVRRGATIAVLLSKGTPQVKTPDLRGQSVRRAVVSLTQSRLRVGRRSYLATALFAPDTVLAQVPEAGVPVNTTTGVDLLLATGPEAPTYFMPYLRNHTLEEALRMFRPVGVVVQKIKTEVHDDLASGSILAQNPAIGTRLKPGSAVTLTSRPSAARPRRTPLERHPVPDARRGRPKRLKIDVLDASGTRTVHTAMEPPGQMVETGVSVTGKASAQVYLNGVFIQEIKVE
jgi:serine/threonine-protein kinase